MTRLIGITGRAGSGKDTAAEALVEIGWRREAFADRMRTALLALDPVICHPEPAAGVRIDLMPVRLSTVIRQLGWDAAKRKYGEIRRLLQKFGTEAGRDIHGEDCWVNALFRNVEFVGGQPMPSPLVVTDCRFANEARAIRGLGGVVVEIIRPGIEPLPGGHASEAGIAPELVDWRIVNDRDVAHLRAEILLIAEGLG